MCDLRVLHEMMTIHEAILQVANWYFANMLFILGGNLINEVRITKTLQGFCPSKNHLNQLTEIKFLNYKHTRK